MTIILIPSRSTAVDARPPSGPKAPPVMKSAPVVRMETSRPGRADLSSAMPNNPPSTQFQTVCHADAPHSPPSTKAQTAANVPKRKRFSHPGAVGAFSECARANSREDNSTPLHGPCRNPTTESSQPRNSASSADDCTTWPVESRVRFQPHPGPSSAIHPVRAMRRGSLPARPLQRPSIRRRTPRRECAAARTRVRIPATGKDVCPRNEARPTGPGKWTESR